MSVYVKTADGKFKKLKLGESGSQSSSVEKLVSASRNGVLTAGSDFPVPAYEVGSGRLQIFLNGVLCIEGADAQYIEATSNTITFNDDIPADFEIVAISM